MPAAYASPMIAPELVPQMTAGRSPAAREHGGHRCARRRTLLRHPAPGRSGSWHPPDRDPGSSTRRRGRVGRIVVTRRHDGRQSLTSVDHCYPDPTRALARASVVLGASPNSARYWPANRPRCQKPKSEAARVTASRINGASRSTRRTSSSAARRRKAVGDMPWQSLNASRTAAPRHPPPRSDRQRHPLVLHVRRVRTHAQTMRKLAGRPRAAAVPRATSAAASGFGPSETSSPLRRGCELRVSSTIPRSPPAAGRSWMRSRCSLTSVATISPPHRAAHLRR